MYDIDDTGTLLDVAMSVRIDWDDRLLGIPAHEGVDAHDS